MFSGLPPLGAAGLLIIVTLAPAQTGDWQEQPAIKIEDPHLRGAVYSAAERALYAWGAFAWKVDLDTGRVRRIAVAESPGGFGEAGALWENVAERQWHLLLQDGHPEGALIMLETTTRRRNVIEARTSTKDLMVMTLFNRRGVISVHHGGQVRFHELPLLEAGRREPPAYREIYSFYTASWQAGLLAADVDSDGRLDLLCGAYWLKSPMGFSLPWRLSAIHNFFDRSESSVGRLLWLELFEKGKPGVVFAQRESAPARLVWLPRPHDPSALWPAVPLAPELKLRRLRGLAAGDLTGDGLLDLVVGEDAGVGSRIVILRNLGPSSMAARTLTTTQGVQQLWILDNNRRIVAVTSKEIRRWMRPF